MVIKVIPVGKKMNVSMISSHYDSSRYITNFYKKLQNMRKNKGYYMLPYMLPPGGTVCYPKVKVLT